jgi:predicted ATPase with chaperone activity
VLRVARTIADLEAAEQVLPSHIATALAWRTDSAAKELMAA